jgi:hypothetical protein
MYVHYLLISMISMLGLLWILVRIARRRNMPPDDDNGGGGFGGDNLPIIDLPPGSGLDDWLTDRIPETPISSPKNKPEKV